MGGHKPLKKHKSLTASRGFTLMEILLSVALIAIFGVFVMEFLTTAWLASEKDFSRIKCTVAAENIIELAGALAIASPTNDLETTYKRILSNDFVSDPPPDDDVSTYTSIVKTSVIQPDRFGNFLAQIATEPHSATNLGTYTLSVGDSHLANVVEIQTGYATKPVEINYNLDIGL